MSEPHANILWHHDHLPYLPGCMPALDFELRRHLRPSGKMLSHRSTSADVIFINRTAITRWPSPHRCTGKTSSSPLNFKCLASAEETIPFSSSGGNIAPLKMVPGILDLCHLTLNIKKPITRRLDIWAGDFVDIVQMEGPPKPRFVKTECSKLYRECQ